MDQKKEFIILSKTGKFTIVELCEMFGISRTTAYKYLDRYAKQGYKGLEELSRIPHHRSDSTSKEVVDAIIKLRKKHPRWGARVLKRKEGRSKDMEKDFYSKTAVHHRRS